MKRISTEIPLSQWQNLPSGALFSSPNPDGLRVHLSRRGDTLVAEAEASLQAELLIEERLSTQECQTASATTQSSIGWWRGIVPLVVVLVAAGIMILKRMTP